MHGSWKQRLPLVLGLLAYPMFLFSCSSDRADPAHPAAPETGRVQVAVYDQGVATLPVEGVSIRILPADVVVVTDQEGVAVFDLPPGSYTVTAAVCCIGPAFIRYDEAAVVVSGRTTTVQMNACLACL